MMYVFVLVSCLRLLCFSSNYGGDIIHVMIALQVDLKHDLSLCSDDGTNILNERFVIMMVITLLFMIPFFFRPAAMSMTKRPNS